MIMKKYFIDLLIGIISGLVLFFIAEFVFRRSILSLNSLYYFLFIPIFIIYTFFHGFKERFSKYPNKFLFLITSFFFFVLGFFLPIFMWFILFKIALSNWQLL